MSMMTSPPAEIESAPGERTPTTLISTCKLYFELAGHVFLIDCLDDWSASAVSQLVDSWLVEPISLRFEPDYIIRIRSAVSPPSVPAGLEQFEISDGGICHSDGQTIYVALDRSLIVAESATCEVNVWIKSRYELSSRILSQILSQALGFAWRRCGLFLLHSAGVVMPGQDKTLLIAGESGSGKSTLTLQLAAAGWKFLSDDSIFLITRAQGTETRGLRKCFALTSDTMAAMQFETAPSSTTPAAWKRRISPDELFPDRQVRSAFAGSIVFPAVSSESESRIVPLEPSETMHRLMRLAPWACYDKPTAAANLKVFESLAREVPAYDLFAGKDLLGKPDLAASLASRAYRNP
jgi:hypothetical protein